MRIEIVSGSSRDSSVTYRLALHLQKQLESISGVEAGIIDVREQQLPPIQNVITSPEKAPDLYRELAERVFAADAFILVSPEYNGSPAPALLNLFDHFPKQSHKAFGIATGSPGALGGMRAALHLQQFVAGLFGILSPHMLITPQIDKKFDANGDLLDETFRKSIDNFTGELLWLTEQVTDLESKYSTG